MTDSWTQSRIGRNHELGLDIQAESGREDLNGSTGQPRPHACGTQKSPEKRTSRRNGMQREVTPDHGVLVTGWQPAGGRRTGGFLAPGGWRRAKERRHVDLRGARRAATHSIAMVVGQSLPVSLHASPSASFSRPTESVAPRHLGAPGFMRAAGHLRWEARKQAPARLEVPPVKLGICARAPWFEPCGVSAVR